MKKMISRWMPVPFIPPKELTIQASGVCFTENGNIVLVNDGKNWLLPGGTPEGKESMAETLIREVREEACSQVLGYEYIGSIRSEQLTPVTHGGPPVFYKARFWARVRLETFDPRFEIKKRRVIAPNQMVAMLSWNARKTAKEILKQALMVEYKKTRCMGQYHDEQKTV